MGDTSHKESELDRGLESLGKVVEGVAGRLLGPKVLGKGELPDGPALSEDADRAIEEAGETVGKLLNAAGVALKEHPLDPSAAVRTAQAHTDDPVPTPEGYSPLVGGMRSLGGGLFKVAEGVLDKVAPRKPKPPGAGTVVDADDEG